MLRFEGCTAIVTGGGSGIGRALAVELVARGAADVTVLDRDAEAAEVVATEIGGHARPVDVGDAAQVREAIEETLARRGGVDLLCSNAGVLGEGGIDASDEVWHQNIQVNLMAHVYAARAVLPSMLRRGGGHLLQTVSAAGLLAAPFAIPYTVSKHAALALAESISMHHRDQGIVVSCLCPQGVATPMLQTHASSGIRDMMERIATPMTPEVVATFALDGVAEGRFLLLPHPEVQGYIEGRARDRDGWLRGLARLISGAR